MNKNMFTKEEMHADQAEFRLLVLISKYARDPWRRSLTSQTDHWGEWRMRRVFTINHWFHNENATRMCGRGMRRAADQRVVVSFHTIPKDSRRRKLHPWRFELETVPSRLPCGHPHRHELTDLYVVLKRFGAILYPTTAFLGPLILITQWWY